MFSSLRNIRGRVFSVVENVRVCPNFSTETVVNKELHPYKLFKLNKGPLTAVSCSRSEALSYYETMQLVRRMETTISNLYKEKKIRGFCHLYSGQEAVAVGIEAALIPGDSIITAYRCHGFLITRGETPSCVMAELMGRKTGNVGGKGGSMHMYTKDFYGGNGIVGAQIPLGAGIALQKKITGTNNVCVSLYGDGAANQGQVFETFNMAKLWDLPCIFICENNKYGMGTSAERASANTAYYSRGDYIPGIWVNAMDILAVREAMRFATDWCRSGKGPIIIEAETYRYYGHSMSDPGTSYRTRDEIQSVRRERDPIIVFGHFMTSSGLATDEEIKAIDNKVRQEVEKQLTECLAAPEPEASSAFEHVYCKNPDNFSIRGCDVSKRYVPKG